jgi:hypothetical protein
MLDGRPDPAAADSAVSAKKIDDYTFELTFKAKGKVLFTTKNVIAKDGKTRTATRTGTTPQGETITSTILFEKQ